MNRIEQNKDAYPYTGSVMRVSFDLDDTIFVSPENVKTAQNGERYGFRVLIVGEQDNEWDKKIIEIMKEGCE